MPVVKGFLAACMQVEPCPTSHTSVVGASDASSSGGTDVSPSASSVIGQREVGCVCLCACVFTLCSVLHMTGQNDIAVFFQVVNRPSQQLRLSVSPSGFNLHAQSTVSTCTHLFIT